MFAMALRKRRTCTHEQRSDPVRLVRQVGRVDEVAQNLDLTETAQLEWVRQAEEPAPSGSGMTAAAHKRLEQLRRENKRQGCTVPHTGRRIQQRPVPEQFPGRWAPSSALQDILCKPLERDG